MKILPNNLIELTTLNDPKVISILNIRTVWINLPQTPDPILHHYIAINLNNIPGNKPIMIEVHKEEALAVSYFIKQLSHQTILIAQNTRQDQYELSVTVKLKDNI